MLSFKKAPSSLGLPTFSVWAGANLLGYISNIGAAAPGMAWKGTAPDGTKVAGTSKAKIAQKLQIHAAQSRAA